MEELRQFCLDWHAVFFRGLLKFSFSTNKKPAFRGKNHLTDKKGKLVIRYAKCLFFKGPIDSYAAFAF